MLLAVALCSLAGVAAGVATGGPRLVLLDAEADAWFAHSGAPRPSAGRDAPPRGHEVCIVGEARLTAEHWKLIRSLLPHKFTRRRRAP